MPDLASQRDVACSLWRVRQEVLGHLQAELPLYVLQGLGLGRVVVAQRVINANEKNDVFRSHDAS